MTGKRRKRHGPEQIVRKLRDADTMLNVGKDVAAVLQALEVSEATYLRWRNQYGGMKAQEAKRLKALEQENARLNVLGRTEPSERMTPEGDRTAHQLPKLLLGPFAKEDDQRAGVFRSPFEKNHDRLAPSRRVRQG